MGLFKNKNQNPTADTNANIKYETGNSDELIKRLSSHAGNVIEMLKGVLATEQGINYATLLLYASGLAGYACQQAVVANRESAVEIELKDGRKYYYGDSVNAYLLEKDVSVLAFMNGMYHHKTGKKPPEIKPLIEHATAVLGDNSYKIWNAYSPDQVYTMIRACWEGIYNNMTSRYCETPTEWPIFFGIVLQNIMAMGMDGDRADEVYKMTMECMLHISKMRENSLLIRG